jgi:hypothetical protein
MRVKHRRAIQHELGELIRAKLFNSFPPYWGKGGGGGTAPKSAVLSAVGQASNCT